MKDENIKRIGWIGIGNMGFPMVVNLLSSNCRVNVYTRNDEKANKIKAVGANICSSISSLVDVSDIIFLILPDDDACEESISIMKRSNITGKLIVNMSTILPELSIKLSIEMEQLNIGYFEAPVSGSIKPATEGTLIILAAGKGEYLDILCEYFNILSKKVFYIGEIGQALRAKIVVNYYMSIVILGLADSVLFAEKLGLKDENILDIINSSPCSSAMTQAKTPLIVERNFKAAFPLKYMLKDLMLGKGIGLRSKLSNLILESYRHANEDYGLKDLMAIINYLKNENNIHSNNQ